MCLLLSGRSCIGDGYELQCPSKQASKQASKLTHIYYMYTPGQYAEDFLRIPARRVCARRMGKRPSYEYDTLSREW